jgi:uncharacterized protein (DUF433 family)
MPTLLDTTLVRTPGICGGHLRIDGTRMTVNQIVTLYKQGLTAPQIVEQYPQRTLSEIYTVLAWYHAHQAEFDQELAREAIADERASRQPKVASSIRSTSITSVACTASSLRPVESMPASSWFLANVTRSARRSDDCCR